MMNGSKYKKKIIQERSSKEITNQDTICANEQKDKEARIIELVSRFQEATSNTKRALETLN